jgi:ribosomal protein L12E/L44/L45/RPP1/RPP2
MKKVNYTYMNYDDDSFFVAEQYEPLLKPFVEIITQMKKDMESPFYKTLKGKSKLEVYKTLATLGTAYQKALEVVSKIHEKNIDYSQGILQAIMPLVIVNPAQPQEQNNEENGEGVKENGEEDKENNNGEENENMTDESALQPDVEVVDDDE